MKHLIGLAGAGLLLNLLAGVAGAAEPVDERIAQAVLPLPADLQAGATVVFLRSCNGRAQGASPRHQFHGV